MASGIARLITVAVLIGFGVGPVAVGDSVVPPAGTEVRVVKLPFGPMVPEDRIDEAWANQFRLELERTYLQKVKSAAGGSGDDPSELPVPIESDSAVTEYRGHRIAIVRVTVPGLHRAVTVLGVVGPDVVQVTCLGGAAYAQLLADAKCQATIEGVFGGR